MATLVVGVLLLATAPLPGQTKAAPGRESEARSGKPSAASSSSITAQEDLKQDLKTMRSLLERMQTKAHMLGSETVIVHQLHTGFARF